MHPSDLISGAIVLSAVLLLLVAAVFAAALVLHNWAQSNPILTLLLAISATLIAVPIYRIAVFCPELWRRFHRQHFEVDHWGYVPPPLRAYTWCVEWIQRPWREPTPRTIVRNVARTSARATLDEVRRIAAGVLYAAELASLVAFWALYLRFMFARPVDPTLVVELAAEEEAGIVSISRSGSWQVGVDIDDGAMEVQCVWTDALLRNASTGIRKPRWRHTVDGGKIPIEIEVQDLESAPEPTGLLELSGFPWVSPQSRIE
ncbi:hypothetical protein F4779DRAFT_623541 [Xylariaceae sp. FL0662B]|nr:hypothetical protein F4779DRAFT_623541 [Xylariaceae sp. FL0662B]